MPFFDPAQFCVQLMQWPPTPTTEEVLDATRGHAACLGAALCGESPWPTRHTDAHANAADASAMAILLAGGVAMAVWSAMRPRRTVVSKP